ncbi:MAG: hypothetical protein KGH67_05285 [Candidatus Micrarchaeota archaeon]|nr:hypothetical protein [Candidatus Micrarchaeota archaeon]MDE1859910.1 hypothetical protein [Candidatus Micrarchaeota archaeon]
MMLSRGIIAILGMVVVIILIFAVRSSLPQAVNIFHETTISSTSKATSSTLASTQTTTLKTSTSIPYSNVPPVVNIVSPKNISTVNGNVTILANVTDVLKIKKVQFAVGNVIYATVNTAPYSYIWNTDGLAKPQYVITVYAYDAANNIGQASVLVNIGLVQHGK